MSDTTTIRIEDIAGNPCFRRLQSLRGVPFDLRYAGSNNFAGRVLYGGMDCEWLRSEAAAGVEAAAAWLAKQRPGWRILILDALRPQRVQEAIWREVAGSDMQHYFAEPARGSIHSFGMALDVTLLDADGIEADMGSGFDEMSLASHPALHEQHLASGLLTPAQVAHRDWLARAMQHGGFEGIATEWWHFNHGDPAGVRGSLPRVY